MLVIAAASLLAGCGSPVTAGEAKRAQGASFGYPLEGRPERIAIDRNDLEAKIDSFAEELYQRRLTELNPATFDQIIVGPFQVERFDQTSGLISDEPENSDDIWWVTAEPGDYMAFSPPWDLGEYDT